MRLRYAGACRVCGVELPAKVEAIYERTTKTVRCVSHDVRPAVEPAVVEVVESGTAGASARREFERRKAKREERIRTKHPKLGGLMLAVSDEQQSTTAWDRNAGRCSARWRALPVAGDQNGGDGLRSGRRRW